MYIFGKYLYYSCIFLALSIKLSYIWSTQFINFKSCARHGYREFFMKFISFFRICITSVFLLFANNIIYASENPVNTEEKLRIFCLGACRKMQKISDLEEMSKSKEVFLNLTYTDTSVKFECKELGLDCQFIPTYYDHRFENYYALSQHNSGIMLIYSLRI